MNASAALPLSLLPSLRATLPMVGAASGAIILNDPSARSLLTAVMHILSGPAGTPTAESTRALAAESLKPQVIEAQVLGNTLLSGTRTSATRPLLRIPTALLGVITQTPAGGTAPPQGSVYRVELQWQGRPLDLVSSRALPPGSRVAIDVGASGQPSLLRVAMPSAGLGAARLPFVSLPSTELLSPPPQRTLAQPAVTAVLEQARREALPRQEPLNRLLPRLASLADAGTLPRPVLAALRELLQTLPRAEQLSQSAGLKRALAESGTPVRPEARPQIGEPRANMRHGTTSSSGGDDSVRTKPARADTNAVPRPAPAESDAAAVPRSRQEQISQLLQLLRPLLGAVPKRSDVAVAEELLSLQRPDIPEQAARAAAAEPSTTAELATLQRLLQAALARLQIHQLDTLASRQPAGNEPSAAANAQPPTWIAELPIHTPRGFDQLQMRLERRTEEQNGRKATCWQIQLDFDLHDMGRFSASLRLNGAQVAATLWSEKEGTHYLVRNAVKGLRTRLQDVGVQVTDVACRLGLPTAAPPPLRQLIDVRT